MARSDERWHPIAPENWHNPKEQMRKTAEVVNGVLHGRMNNRGTITLSVSQAGGAVTATPLIDDRISPDAVVVFMPTTASARSQGALYVTSLTVGGCKLNHTSTDSTDAIFDYVVFS